MSRFHGFRRTKTSAASVKTTETAQTAGTLVSHPCPVLGCKNRIHRNDFALCNTHYDALPARLKTELKNSRWSRDKTAKGRAFVTVVTVLEYLDAADGQAAFSLEGDLSHA